MSHAARKTSGLVILLIVAGITAFVLAFLFGSSGIGLSDLGKILSGEDAGQAGIIFFRIRLPRAILCFFSGAALSVAGAVIQGMFQNPMADSYVIGVSSGASLGAAVAMSLSLQASIFGFGFVEFFAFIGALIAVFTVYRLASRNRKVSMLSLLLSGIAISTLCSALVYCLMLLFHEKAESILMWTLGSFSGASPERVLITVPILILCSSICLFFSRDLNILLQGDETARHLGVEAPFVRFILLTVTTLMVSAVVSVSGVIGFVGLIVPHMIRTVAGPDHKRLLPLSFLCGGVFLLLCDTVARTVSEQREIPIGVITAMIGVPFFLFLMQKRKRGTV